jgi:hypothetical protein
MPDVQQPNLSPTTPMPGTDPRRATDQAVRGAEHMDAELFCGERIDEQEESVKGKSERGT